MKLTDQQEKFVQELIRGKSQRQAYLEAYPKSANWKVETVDQAASRLFNNSKVRARYDEIHNKMIKEAEDECIFDGKRILQELAKIAFADRTDFAKVKTIPKLIKFWDPDLECYVYQESEKYCDQIVQMTDTDDLTPSQRSVISGIKNTRNGIVVETYDKQAALMALGKAAGIFVDRLEVTGQVANPYEGLSTEELIRLAELDDEEEDPDDE